MYKLHNTACVSAYVHVRKRNSKVYFVVKVYFVACFVYVYKLPYKDPQFQVFLQKIEKYIK